MTNCACSGTTLYIYIEYETESSTYKLYHYLIAFIMKDNSFLKLKISECTFSKIKEK